MRDTFALMKIEKGNSKELYYTNDHEWIDFQGSVAYTGICLFKLSGFKEIHHLCFIDPFGLKKKGDVIASISYNDYQIEAHMPVDGKIIQVNESLLSDDVNGLLTCAENTTWLALIVPAQPYDRKDLLLPKQYQLNGKGKHAK